MTSTHNATNSQTVHRIPTIRRECRFCSETFRAHPGFADHEDRCDLNPINRPHIIGEAVSMYGGQR